jgi:hypothetical protein
MFTTGLSSFGGAFNVSGNAIASILLLEVTFQGRYICFMVCVTLGTVSRLFAGARFASLDAFVSSTNNDLVHPFAFCGPVGVAVALSVFSFFARLGHVSLLSGFLCTGCNAACMWFQRSTIDMLNRPGG